MTRRGKVLGGSSLLNYMAWDRGSKEEYDAWKAVSEAEGGWDWDSLLPFLTKVEDAAPAAVNPDMAVEVSAVGDVVSPGLSRDKSVGVGGPVKVGSVQPEILGVQF